MSDPRELKHLRQYKAALLDQLASLSDFRAGTLVGRYRKCGKPGCRCAREGVRGHGPSWSLTRSVAGKTVTKIIAAAAVDTTERQIAEYHRFQHTVGELVETNIKICDALLEVAGTAEDDPERAEKRGSKTRSRRKSRPS